MGEGGGKEHFTGCSWSWVEAADAQQQQPQDGQIIHESLNTEDS